MGLLYPFVGIPMKPNQFFLQGLVHVRRYLGSLCSSVPLANLEPFPKHPAGPMNCSSESMYMSDALFFYIYLLIHVSKYYIHAAFGHLLIYIYYIDRYINYVYLFIYLYIFVFYSHSGCLDYIAQNVQLGSISSSFH